MAVDLDYNDVVGVSEEEFRARAACFVADVADPNKFTRSDQKDIAKIERLLDVKEGSSRARATTIISQDINVSAVES
jgi:hypothetical protein